MRLLLYILLIGAFAALGFMLTPALGLLGILAGWASAAGILWAYDDALQGGAEMHNNYLFPWMHGSDGAGTIFDFNGFDAGSGGDGGGSD